MITGGGSGTPLAIGEPVGGSTPSTQLGVDGSGNLAIATYTGWNIANQTWTYATAGSFTLPGNVVAQFPVGTLISLNQSGVKYFTVTGASFAAGTTTVTITGGSDFTLANAAITSPLFSYAANPQGWPGWFNWTPTLTGFSGTPTIIARFAATGRKCTLEFLAFGTGNSAAMTMTLPIAPSAVGPGTMIYPAFFEIGGTKVAGQLEIDTSTGSTASFTNFSGTGGGSGTCLIGANPTYEI